MTRSLATTGIRARALAHVAGRGLVVALLLMTLAALAVTFVPGLLGYERYVLVGGSMEPTIHRGSLVFDEIVPVRDLRAGDVITYVPPGRQQPVTHRIISVEARRRAAPSSAPRATPTPPPDMRPFQLDKPTQARYSFSVPYLGWVFIALGNPQTRLILLALPALLVVMLHARAACGARAAGWSPSAERHEMRRLSRGSSPPSRCCCAVTASPPRARATPSSAAVGRRAGDPRLDPDGVALLHGEQPLPGDSVTGLITLTNEGDEPGTLALAIDDVRDSPGVYGGRLSNVLRLRLEDLTTRRRAGRDHAHAQRADRARRRAAAASRRTYRVIAHFPDTGRPAGPALGDNLLSRARASRSGWRWQLSADGSATCRRPADAAPARHRRARCTARRPPRARVPSARRARRSCTCACPAQRVIKPRKLSVYAKCDVRCKLRFSAKIDNAPKRQEGQEGEEAPRR